MHMKFTFLTQCLNTCTWIFPIMFFITLPDSGCEYTLFELNRLFGPIVLLRSRSVVSVIPMNNMCCSDDPIPRSAQSRLVPSFALELPSPWTLNHPYSAVCCQDALSRYHSPCEFPGY
eukprot:1159092-Pelagomonas_calceolata.AAC.1